MGSDGSSDFAGSVYTVDETWDEHSVTFDTRPDIDGSAIATADVPVESGDQSNLSDALSKKLQKTIILKNEVDPEILGGLVLRYGDLVVDGSVRTRLESVASRLKAYKLGSELVHEN